MKLDDVLVYVLIGVAWVVVWVVEKAENEDGTVFPGLPFFP